ncbi:hypothetical protein ACFWXO_38870 [Kitasatospora sp. NPDC059088]|uniref:hypothetical protein n=1 Tax=Kitasatospora sp. NPDC059088 TaxID=3346722 RepID=UPI0036D19355
MKRPFGPLTYTSAECAEESEAFAATASGGERLDALVDAAVYWTDAGSCARALALLDEVAAARTGGLAAEDDPGLDRMLALYAFTLHTAGRGEEARDAFTAAEAYARGSGDWYAFEDLADHLAGAGQDERAVRHWTTALDLLLPEAADPPAGRDHGAQEHGGWDHAARERAVHRIRAERRGARARLGLPSDAHDLAPSPGPRRGLFDRLLRRGS